MRRPDRTSRLPDRLGGLVLWVLAWMFFPSFSSAEPDTTQNLLSHNDTSGVVVWATLDDVIGPVSARYLVDAIHAAESRQAAAVVIELDTPGGLDTSMRQIIKAILASEVPVCVFVSPKGARAASAGVYISYSAHVAAMSPGTNLGAASPVSFGGGQVDTVMASKMKNDAAAYLKSLARLRGRNEAWAAEAVEHAVSLPAEDAVAQDVVDLLATGPRDLLAKIDGRTTDIQGQAPHVLRTRDATIVEYKMSWRYRILSALNNPNVAYLLLLLGFYGLFFELSNPGAIFPGILGGIALILGLFALQNLSINYAGLLLILFGVVLFLLETQVTSHGLLAIGGTASLLVGSLLLIEAPEPYLRVSLKVIIPAVVLTASFFLFAATMGLRAQRRKVVAGREGLVGMIGNARTPLTPQGTIFVAGEHWTAVTESGESLPAGASVEVVSIDRLTLTVRPARA
ncbi:MAG TPA: nodulation protein NfeD [Candidatus Eisenbacteria bacterium]|nr:nodulation protein NfeD [Candidatus Eisenbacteria bacterium]